MQSLLWHHRSMWKRRGGCDTHRCVECWSCWGKLTFYQKSSKVRQGIVTDDLCKFFFFLAYPRCTHTHFIFYSLSCPPGSHQTFSVKPSFLLPPVEFTLLLLFAESLSCAALFWHWKVHLCFSGCIVLMFLQHAWATFYFYFFLRENKSHQGGEAVASADSLSAITSIRLAFVSRLTCFLSMSAHCHLSLFSPSTSMHLLPFILPQRQTQELVTQLPLHPLQPQIPFDLAIESCEIDWKRIHRNGRWWKGLLCFWVHSLCKYGCICHNWQQLIIGLFFYHATGAHSGSSFPHTEGPVHVGLHSPSNSSPYDFKDCQLLTFYYNFDRKAEQKTTKNNQYFK